MSALTCAERAMPVQCIHLVTAVINSSMRMLVGLCLDASKMVLFVHSMPSWSQSGCVVVLQAAAGI